MISVDLGMILCVSREKKKHMFSKSNFLLTSEVFFPAFPVLVIGLKTKPPPRKLPFLSGFRNFGCMVSEIQQFPNFCELSQQKATPYLLRAPQISGVWSNLSFLRLTSRTWATVQFFSCQALTSAYSKMATVQFASFLHN